MTFRILPLRFDFVARSRVAFPPGKAGNMFRGAFGITLRRVCCPATCESAATCPAPSECVYARLFEPRAQTGPSGLADSPRPFVLRAAALDGQSFEPGQAFSLEVNMFDLEIAATRSLALTWQRLGEGRFDLRRSSASAPVEVDLAAARPAHRVRVRFLTPTELKGAGQVRREPEFATLFARLRDRISTLRQLYQGGPLDIDFKAMAARAAEVRLTASDLRWETAERYSTRTHQTHPLGGITGWAEYSGPLGEFLPYLEAGYWTGAGRQTVWGKGVIRPESQVTEPRS